MSKTTPVRWWRDDATRYRRRPPYVAPPSEPIEWAFELLRPTSEQFAERARRRNWLDAQLRWLTARAT
jgi:hypothetical protein